MDISPYVNNGPIIAVLIFEPLRYMHTFMARYNSYLKPYPSGIYDNFSNLYLSNTSAYHTKEMIETGECISDIERYFLTKPPVDIYDINFNLVLPERRWKYVMTSGQIPMERRYVDIAKEYIIGCLTEYSPWLGTPFTVDQLHEHIVPDVLIPENYNDIDYLLRDIFDPVSLFMYRHRGIPTSKEDWFTWTVTANHADNTLIIYKQQDYRILRYHQAEYMKQFSTNLPIEDEL